MKKIVLTFVVLAMLLSTVSCSLLSSGNGGGYKPNLPEKITVNYYDGVTRSYSPEEYSTTIQCEHLAPSGQYITGLYDESGIQYADYTCKVSLSNSMPEVLYARYKDVDLSNFRPETAADEDPFYVSFYAGKTFSWDFDEEEFLSACLCNPYADVEIVVKFVGKGNGESHHNTFYSKLMMKDNVVESFSQDNLGSAYKTYSYTATVKAKQIINSNFTINVSTSARFGYEDYVVKNIDISFNFIFEE